MVRNVPVAITLVLGLFFGWHYAGFRTTPPARPASTQTHILQNNILATGTVNALETVQVGSQVSGVVKAVYADYKTKVRRGQVLALVDPGPFVARLSEAQAELESAKAEAHAQRVALKEAKVGVRIARDQSVTQQRAADISASAENLAKLTLDHDEAQAGFGAVSDNTVRSDQATYNLAELDRQMAEAGSEGARLTISEKQAEVQQAEAEIDVADARVRQDESAVELARANLDRTEIRSPIDGVVLQRSVSGGETVIASSVAPTLFLLIPDAGKLQLDVDLSESEIGQVYPGQSATFTVDALPGKTLQAVVRQIRKDAVNVDNVVSFDVVMDVLDPPAKLFPGMTAAVTIPTLRQPKTSSLSLRG